MLEAGRFFPTFCARAARLNLSALSRVTGLRGLDLSACAALRSLGPEYITTTDLAVIILPTQLKGDEDLIGLLAQKGVAAR